jgi:hypothetical protein
VAGELDHVPAVPALHQTELADLHGEDRPVEGWYHGASGHKAQIAAEFLAAGVGRVLPGQGGEVGAVFHFMQQPLGQGFLLGREQDVAGAYLQLVRIDLLASTAATLPRK